MIKSLVLILFKNCNLHYGPIIFVGQFFYKMPFLQFFDQNLLGSAQQKGTKKFKFLGFFKKQVTTFLEKITKTTVHLQYMAGVF
jgi:hypothetical protein